MNSRFFLIDDDPGTLRMLERIIVEQGLGTVVGTAGDGIAGEEGVLLRQPDIVIIDLLMPRRDGLDTVASLKGQGYDGCFVLLSRVTDKGAVQRAYESGVRFFVHKPLNLVEISTVLNQVTESLRMQQTLQSLRSGLRALYETGAVVGLSVPVPREEPAPPAAAPGRPGHPGRDRLR